MTGYWGMNIEIERFTSMPYDDYGFWLVGKSCPDSVPSAVKLRLMCA
jgi:hypothetical protein